MSKEIKTHTVSIPIEEYNQLKAQLIELKSNLMACSDENIALRDEIAELKADAERLNFMIKTPCWFENKKTDAGSDSYQLFTQDEDENYITLHDPNLFFKSPREAIDQARKA